jgi:chromosomal replication initiation ATPase DnaA
MPSAARQSFTILRVPHHHMGDANLYRAAAREFKVICEQRSYLNQCTIARTIGARVFGVTNAQVLSRDPAFGDVRQKLMAFVKVMTGATDSQIGRAFGRDHTSVAYACRKYADAIHASLRGTDLD